MSDRPRFWEIPIVVNEYLPPGKVYLVSPQPEPVRLPFTFSCDFGTQDQTAITVIRNLPMKMPERPKFLVLDTILKETESVDRRWRRRERKLVSRKQREKARRRLDYSSNVRRRKRWAELRMRRGK